jgi:general secretion pathway protein J
MSERGLTLIELLVALAVFAVLGVLSWRSTAQMLAGDRRLHAETERWQALERSFGLLEQDLLQVAGSAGLELCTPPGTGGSTPKIFQSESPEGAATGDPASPPDSVRGNTLGLLTLAPGSGTRRVAWRQVGDRLEWRRWPDGGNPVLAAADIVLDGVRSLRWQVLAAGGGLHDCWPLPGQSGNKLPAALVIRLELADIGPVERWYALR